MELSWEGVEIALRLMAGDRWSNVDAEEAYIWMLRDQTIYDPDQLTSRNSTRAMLEHLDTPYVRELKVRVVLARLES